MHLVGLERLFRRIYVAKHLSKNALVVDIVSTVVFYIKVLAV